MASSNVSQAALSVLFHQNQQVDEMREIETRSVWDGLPYQDLHSKLDKIEQNFLKEMNKGKDKATKGKCWEDGDETINRLEKSIRRSTGVAQMYIDSMREMMEKQIRLRRSN